MTEAPIIRAPGDLEEFHDSSLIDLQMSAALDRVRVILSTPDAHGAQRLWMVTCEGILRFEFETTGSGRLHEPDDPPIEIYTVYDARSSERERWRQRLIELGVPLEDANHVHHVVFASSFVRGWGHNEASDGIHVICRSVRVDPAPGDYKGEEFARPVIAGGDD